MIESFRCPDQGETVHIKDKPYQALHSGECTRCAFHTDDNCREEIKELGIDCYDQTTGKDIIFLTPVDYAIARLTR